MQPHLRTSSLDMMGKRSRRSPVHVFSLAFLLCRSQGVASFTLISQTAKETVPFSRGGSGSSGSVLISPHRSSSPSTTTIASPRFLSKVDDESIKGGSEVIGAEEVSMSTSTAFDQKQLSHRLNKLNRDPLWPQDHGTKRKGISSSREKIPKTELRDFISGAATAGRRVRRTTPISNNGETNNNANQQPSLADLSVGFDPEHPSSDSDGAEIIVHQHNNFSSDSAPNFDFKMKQLAHRRQTLSRNPMWPQSQYAKKSLLDAGPTEEILLIQSNAEYDNVGSATESSGTKSRGNDDSQPMSVPLVDANAVINEIGAIVVSSDATMSVNDDTQPTPPRSDMNSVPVHTSIASDAGPLWKEELRDDAIHPLFSSRKRVLVLCTGGTLTMSNDPTKGNTLVPVQGALTSYLAGMKELTEDPDMPEIISHEYKPLIDSSDMGPGDWAMLARDINTNYYYFDGFVILMGTDTMAYAASALSFMLQNLSKPVIFTGSQIPLREPYNDARKNLIMATIFASSDTVSEVCIFFHDRLLRGCRATKVNTSKLKAFDSPNSPPLAEIGINIEENYHIFRPPPRGSFKINTSMDTRLITLRLVPGFDDASMKAMIDAATRTELKGLVLQLYGTGNLPSLKDDLVQCLADATAAGVVVVATTQCLSGSVIMGHYATGQKLLGAGVVSACDMTVEATTTKLAYLLGRGDLSISEVRDLMTVDLRGEMTPESDLPPPPLASTYQRVIAQKNRSRRY